MFWGAYTDFLWRDFKIKPRPTVLHERTCPDCNSKRVNVYYSAQLDKYICKKCRDKLSEQKGGAE